MAAKKGRPYKMDPQTVETIVANIRDGAHPEVAAGAAGIDRATFYRWMAYPDFATAVARARDEAELELLRTTKGGDGQGIGFGQAKAALEILSRSRPQRWAQRVNVKVEEELSALLDVLEEVLPHEWYVKALEAIDARRNDSIEIPRAAHDDSGEDPS